jgi:predicted amidophosphoribosyltransferase
MPDFPPCFWTRLYVCPNETCGYIGSAMPQFKTGYCWCCTEPLTDDDIVEFEPRKVEALADDSERTS